MKRTNEIFRLIFSIIFLLGSITNLFLLLTNPGLYTSFADLSLLETYITTWSDIVVPNINIMILMVAIFEFVLAFLIASKERAVHAGLILAVIFMVFLVPFWWGGGAIINILFIIILLWLVRFEYPLSLTERFFGDQTE